MRNGDLRFDVYLKPCRARFVALANGSHPGIYDRCQNMIAIMKTTEVTVSEKQQLD